MQTFISRIAEEILQSPGPLHKTLVLLPNQRAEIFLREALRPHFSEPTLLPMFATVDGFISSAANVLVVEPLVLLLELYQSYSEVQLLAYPEKEIESLGSFLSWGQTLLADFGEIDRYLLDPKLVLGDLYNAKKLEEWDLSMESETPLMRRYSDFVALLPKTYDVFTERLLAKGEAYSGLAARVLATRPERLESYVKKNGLEHVIIAGLNALNTAELDIIKALRKLGTSKVLWDVDAHYLNMPEHEAGMFFREHQKRLKVFGNDVPSVKDQPSQLRGVTKEIRPVGATQYAGQAKAVAHALEKWQEQGVEVRNIAVILADESLLNPVLSFLPEGFDKVNITMGYPLDQTSIAGTLRLWMSALEYAIKNARKPGSWTLYHRSLSALFTDPLFNEYWFRGEGEHLTEGPQDWNREIVKGNRAFTSAKEWTERLKKGPAGYADALQPAEGLEILGRFKNWLQHVAANEKSDVMTMNTAYQMHTILQQLERTIGGVKADELVLLKLLKQQLRAGTIDFVGEPLEGLQVMGILESRTLDFTHVILAGVNEGVLPSGRSFNTLLPYDIKRHYELPTYEQKDAVYAYHFYRILQRCQQAVITYNTDKNAFGGGEASRFIVQLEHELKGTECTVHPRSFHNGELHPSSMEERFSMERSESIKTAIKAWMSRGISASSLIELSERPHLFYERRLLRIREGDEVEESLSALMMGNLVHNGLEDLYKPLIGQSVPQFDVEDWTEKALEFGVQFLESKGHSRKSLEQGRNLVTLEVCRKMLHQFLSYDRLRTTTTPVQLLGIETELDYSCEHADLGIPLKFIGKVDRIELVGTTLTIWDYKTGSMDNSDLSLSALDQLWEGKKPKAFQVLLYAWLLYKQGTFAQHPLPWSSGMFKLQSGDPEMLLAGKELENKPLITKVLLENFEAGLFQFLEQQATTDEPIVEPAPNHFFK